MHASRAASLVAGGEVRLPCAHLGLASTPPGSSSAAMQGHHVLLCTGSAPSSSFCLLAALPLPDCSPVLLCWHSCMTSLCWQPPGARRKLLVTGIAYIRLTAGC